MAGKKYYWLKLKDDFFSQKEIKRLRRLAGGDTYTIIYLKLLLLSLKNEGKIFFDDVGDDFTDELSLEIDEEMDNVRVTINYLQQKGLLELVKEDEIYLNEVKSMIGSESDSAERVRRYRRSLKGETKLLQCNGHALQRSTNVTKSNTEIEIEIEIEKEKYKSTTDCQPSANQVTTKCHTEDRLGKDRLDKYSYQDSHLDTAKKLQSLILEVNPGNRCKNANLEKWANDIRLMQEKDERTDEELHSMIDYIFNKDDFWRVQIQSPGNLRKHWDKIYPKIISSKKPLIDNESDFQKQLREIRGDN